MQYEGASAARNKIINVPVPLESHDGIMGLLLPTVCPWSFLSKQGEIYETIVSISLEG